MSRRCWIFLAMLLLAPLAAHAEPPHVAVWDPQGGTAESRITLDRPNLLRTVEVLKAGGISVDLLSAAQIADPAAFSADKFDAVMIVGPAVPRMDLAPLKQFADGGGILISLDAEVPFLIAIEPTADKQWALSPAEPKFAWQTDELLQAVGLKFVYKLELHDQGTRHQVTPLLKKYLPEAQDLRGRLASRWIVPVDTSTEIYPLLRSSRRDGADVPSPLSVARSGHRTAILATSRIVTASTPSDRWPLAPKTLVAVAKLAADLRSGGVVLKKEWAVQINPDLTPLASEPLDREAIGSVDPAGAVAVKRWGRFDGSNLEFGPALSGEKQLADGAGDKDFPGVLEAGATVRLPLPELGAGAAYVRLRGAYLASGAAIEIRCGERTVLNESLLFIDTSGASNWSKNLAGRPTEFTRAVFLPPGQAATLTLRNPGKQRLWIDALQVEHASNAPVQRMIGLGAGIGNNYPPKESRKWDGMRFSLRTNFLGAPDDPERWKKLDAHFNSIAAKSGRLQPILEGTPEWAAISPQRLQEAKDAKRPSTVPPDPAKYAQIVEDVIQRYGDKIDSYEVWNEADITQYYRGTTEEYVTLFKTVVPVIRRLDPTAKVMLTGMSGFHEPFLRKMQESGVLKIVDTIPFHPYAGKSPGWDVPYGLLEGELRSWGVGTEIFCNESGFPYSNAEWFKPPPVFTPERQRDCLDIAMARLLGSGLAKLSVFHAGGDDTAYSLIDGRGRARPAYEVFTDYLNLGGQDSTQLQASITSVDGSPLQGVYIAGSRRADGTTVVVVNPAQCDLLSAPSDPTPALAGDAGWVTFHGDAAFHNSTVTVTPKAGQKYAGFYKAVAINPRRFPKLQVTTSGASAQWELLLKESGVARPGVTTRGAGTAEIDLPALLKDDGTHDNVELSFRIYQPTTIESVRFIAAEQKPVEPLPVKLSIPLSNVPGDWSAVATIHGQAQAIPLQVHVGQNSWAELMLPLRERTIIQISRGR